MVWTAGYKLFLFVMWNSYCTCGTHEILSSLRNTASAGLQNQVELKTLKLDSSPFVHKEFTFLLIILSFPYLDHRVLDKIGKRSCLSQVAEFFSHYYIHISWEKQEKANRRKLTLYSLWQYLNLSLSILKLFLHV